MRSMRLEQAPSIRDSEHDWRGALGVSLNATDMEAVDAILKPELPATATLYTDSTH